MAETNISLLATKIAALDPQAQHAVEIAVDSLFDEVAVAPNGVVHSRIATLERRVDALGDQTGGNEVVCLDERILDHPGLRSEIEHLMEAAQRTLDEITRADAVPRHERLGRQEVFAL
jgi:hypothetical protein